MPDHTSRGFWCEFCQDYHAAISCPHPAQEGESAEDVRAERDQAWDENKVLQDDLEDKELEPDSLYATIDDLITEYRDTCQELCERLKGLIA